MKKPKKTRPDRPEESDLAPDYDMKGAVRGKYAARYASATNVVLLDPDVAKAFPTSEDVNTALRELLRLRRKAR
jgi:hypothetical protein